MKKYILEGTTPKECEDPLEWGYWFENYDRVVAKTEVGIFSVSTVFLGLDHSFSPGPPLLFETMVFRLSDWTDVDYQDRCSTWEEAEKMHEKAIQWVKDLEK